MKKFSLPKNITEKAYFYPAVGLLIFIVVNGIIFGFLWIKNNSKGQIAGASDNQEPSPTPQLELASNNEYQAIQTATPTLTPKPSAKTTPKPTVSPTASPTPSPSPTPLVYEKEDIRIISPSNETKYDSTSITVEMDLLANGENEKLEVLVDGSVKHTFTSPPYKTTLEIAKGTHELQGKAQQKSGDTITSGIVKFGSGGTDWNAPEPTATPTPPPSTSP